MLPLLYRFRACKALVVAVLAFLALLASFVFSPGGLLPAYAHSLDVPQAPCPLVSVTTGGQQAAAPQVVCFCSKDIVCRIKKIQPGCFMRFAVPEQGLAGFVYPLQPSQFKQCLSAKGQVVLLENVSPANTLGCLVKRRIGMVVILIYGYVFPVQPAQQNMLCPASRGQLVRLEPPPVQIDSQGESTDWWVQPQTPR